MLALLDLATFEPEPHRIQTQTFVFRPFAATPFKHDSCVVLRCC